MKIDDLIDRLVSGELGNLEEYFGDMENVFRILDRRDRLDELDAHDGYDSWQNAYLLYILNNRPDVFKKTISQLLSDIEFKEDQVILSVSSRGELSELFCDGRDVNKKTITGILDGERDFDWFSDTTDNIYRDVIEELNPKNLARLYERVVYELKDTNVSPDTELLELIAGEQNHPEYVQVTNENVSRIIDDEESTDFILKEYLYDLKSDIYSVHFNASNTAYEDDVFEEVMSELSRYFITPGKFQSREHPYKKNTTIEYFEIPIRDFYGMIGDYLIDRKKYGGYDSVEYYGSFLELMKESVECLRVRFPDYADSRKVDELINEIFGDYI